MFHTIVLSGGGVLGSVHIGFLKYLQQHKLLCVRHVVGTSVGAMIGFLYSCKIPLHDIFEYFCEMNSDLLKVNDATITRIANNFGIDDGEYFSAFLMDILVRFSIPPKITFAEHFDRFGIALTVTVTNLRHFTTEYLSKDSHPSMSIIQAVRCSCSIPLLIEPIVHYSTGVESIWVDGGVTQNYPISHVLGNDETQQTGAGRRAGVIGCNIISWKPSTITSFSEYMLSLIGCLFRKDAIKIYPNTVSVDCCELGFLDLDQERQLREELLQKGYDATHSFINNLSAGATPHVRHHARSQSY